MVLVGVWWKGDDGWDDDDDDDERDDNKASDREDGWESIQPIIVRGREEERDWREDIYGDDDCIEGWRREGRTVVSKKSIDKIGNKKDRPFNR